MRGLWLLAAMLVGVLVGHLECCPREPELEDRGFTQRWFEGTIGGKRVRMYVAHDTKSAVGIFFYWREYEPIILGGTFRNGRIEMEQNYAGTKQEWPSARFTGRMTPGGLTGVWAPLSQNSKARVRLASIKEPSCDVEGPMRVFRDPRWPIVFSYPESWKVDVTSKKIFLSCPDPALLADGKMGMSLELHAGPPGGEQYRQSGSQWKYLAEPFCDTEDERPCPVAKVAERDGITVLGPNEFLFRMYCAKQGYAGQAEGLDGQFVGNGWWIELNATGEALDLLRHIVATARRRVPAK